MKFSILSTVVPAMLALATGALAVSNRVRMYTLSTNTVYNNLDLGSQIESEGLAYMFLGNHGGQFLYHDVLNSTYHSDVQFGDVYYLNIKDNILIYTTDTTDVGHFGSADTLLYDLDGLHWYACTDQNDPAGYNAGQYLVKYYAAAATVPSTCTAIVLNVIAVST
ncbi:uncharacterized protein V2V93DRAFT_187840 [Kockiozyma suomiensis]|uniref:uncharacterized protein n=1 Tax=Kockiozyma suomiensis TaxID=1337062 RepID=UPI003343A414